MINSHHKQKQYGAYTLLIVFVLFIAAVLLIIYAANHSQFQQKSSTNQYSNNQSFEAAEAGLEFGIQYLTQNKATILASPVGGFIPAYSDSNTSNVTLANNSKYTIEYSNPVANNYDLILIKSTGTSADGTSTHVVQQKVQKRSLLSKTITNPSTIVGNVSLQGNADIRNTTGNTTVISGGTVDIVGSATTTSQSGGSSAGNIGSDIQQNNSSIQGLTGEQFFSTYFGASTTTVKSQVINYFPSGSSPNLNGLAGTSIWVDQNYSTNSGDVIGSVSQPVILIVNGDFSISGNAQIYGFIFVIGNITSLTGTPVIDGALAASGSMTLKGTPDIIFDQTVITNLNNTNPTFFAKVTGSWKDF